MALPDGYLASLSDNLAPYGLESGSAQELAGGITEVVFTTDPQSFAQQHPQLGVEFAYGDDWPPPQLRLVLAFDEQLNPLQAEFETIDLLAWTSVMHPELRNRLNTLDDPDDHAAAMAEALDRALAEEDPEGEYLY